MENPAQIIVQSLWIGESLSKVEQLCIRSFIDNGHDFHLYTYGDIKNIPEGTIVCDANEILSSDGIFTYESGWGKGSVSGFADIFRVNLLFKKGGWWVDMDIICLKKFTLPNEVVICTSYEGEYGNLPNNCVLHLPANHPILKYCLDKIETLDVKTMAFGMAGPFLMQNTVTELKLIDEVVPYTYFNPIAWKYVGELVLGKMTFKNKLKEIIRPIFKPATMGGRKIQANSYALHLWNEVWKSAGINKNHTYPANSLFEKLKRKHHIK